MPKRDQGEDRPLKNSGCRLWVNGVELKPAPRWRMDQTIFKQPPPMSFPGSWVALTPAGIDQLESSYARRILDAPATEEGIKALLKVRDDLKKEPRLHQRIKQNLFLNIRTYLREARKAHAAQQQVQPPEL